MQFYQEITIIDGDKKLFDLWSSVFMQVHIALVEHAKAKYGDDATHGDIGVSFPDFRFFEKNGNQISYLGSKLRLFGISKEQLKKLNIEDVIKRYTKFNLTDYVHIKSVQPVPSNHGYITVSRARQIKNLDRIARRRAKHQGISFEQAKTNIIANYAEQHNISDKEAIQAYHNPKLMAYPYINMQSLHGKNDFSLEIKQVEKPEKVDGQFSTYGLSSISTVPHWEKSFG